MKGIKPDDIIGFIHKRGGECTFAEFTIYMKHCYGSYDLYVPGNPMALVWWNLGKDFINSIDQLRGEGKIIYHRTDPEVYEIFRLRPPFPVVPKHGICLQKSWLPVEVQVALKPSGILTP